MRRDIPSTQWRIGSLLCAFITLPLMAGPALAQSAIERHPPPRPEQKPASLTINAQNFGKASEQPLGVDLSGIHLIGKAQPAAKHPAKGLSGTPEGVDPTALDVALKPFLGKPLSLALARDVQAAIAQVYREAGRPFVSVTLPPQEVTSGVLQVRVIEFRAGGIEVSGVRPGEAGRIRRDVRLKPGQRIDARALDEDLTWINRSPYRRAEGVFRPGEQTGASNLSLSVTREKPWQIYGGWTNTGSASTGTDRYFIGANALLEPLNGAWLSYQLTGSGDLWRNPGRIFPRSGGFPQYLSHSGRLVVPTLPRQELEIAPGYVASRERAGPFTAFENATFELPVIYRSAVSNILPGHYWGNVYGGFEVKTLHRDTFFGGKKVAEGSADLFQLVLGWNDTFTDHLGSTSIDVRIKGDPGGILGGNDSGTWATFTNGRVSDISYVYGAFDITRLTRLPERLAWVSQLSGIWSGQPLPDTERLSLGGLSAVRGYNYDDVSVDSGLVWRNELRLPSLSPLQNVIDEPDALSPYLFADLGAGRDQATDDTTTLAGIGGGFDYFIADAFSGTLAAGYALKDAGQTEAGDWTVNVSLTAKF